MQKILLLLLAVFMFFQLAVSQDCKDILKYGIYEQENTKIEKSRTTWYVYKFIKDNYSSYSNAKSMDASAVIPIDEVLIGLDFSQDESGFGQLKTYIEKYFSLQLDEKFKLEKATNKINPNILNIWSECTGRPGPHFFIIYTDNPKKFKLCGYFASEGSEPPRITTGGFDNINGIRILTSGPFFGVDKKLRQVRLPLGRQYQTFERIDGKEINLTINLSHGSSYTVNIPAISLLGFGELLNIKRKEVALTSEWTDNIDIPSKHNCILNFVGQLKFLDPIAPPGQNPRTPSLNSNSLDIRFPANILEYKIVTLDDNNKIIKEEPVNRWDEKPMLITKSNDNRRVQTRILLYWLEQGQNNTVSIKTPTHAQEFFIKNYTHNSGSVNLSSLLSIDN